MIFVTVGTQLPFDRMVRAIDQWAGAKAYPDVFAQIGPAEYRPAHMPWAESLDADECRRKIEQADLVIAHAGMGSILTALELGKPIIVMPRLSALGEHRNDHQLATAKRLQAQGRIEVAFDENQLLEKLDYLESLRPAERITAHASSALLSNLRAFLEGKIIEFPPSAAPADILPRFSRKILLDLPPTGADIAAAGTRGRRYSPRAIKSRLTGLILLAGRLRMTELTHRVGRNRLDLPIDGNRSLLAYWRDEAAQLARAWDARGLPLRVLVDQSSLTPALPEGVPEITVSLERDRYGFRGPGGVLRDVCADYEDEAWVLVANAAQMLFGSLRDLADKLADAGGEINVVSDADGVPNGVMLLRCGVLRAISDVGFHDFKEQVIPALARKHSVKVVATQHLTSRPIHSLKDYAAALRSYYSWRGNGHPAETPGASKERWYPRFAIREEGALVEPTALICDGVILQGAVVERGAVVVRSIVGEGARVRAGQMICDQIVT